MASLAGVAADYQSQEGDWVVRDFKFQTGEVLPELRLHYTTVGAPSGEPVLVLHGTVGSGQGLLTPAFAGELFGPGQPLDASRYYVILPDAIGTGKSTKPSDGLRTKFPQYNYDDMVRAQYRLVTEHLRVRHLRLVLGNSMGGMQTWIWAGKYPDFMDVAVPMASLPVEMASRNWIMRRLIVDSIRNDPEWMEGNYTKQPRSLKFAYVYDPSAGLERIQATLLAINSADDERNPPELGVLDRDIKRVKNGRMFLIPASAQTAGHGTTGNAKFWKKEVAELLQSAPRAPK